MSDDEPIDPEALLAMVAETTVRASPRLVVGEFHPRIGAMAVLTVVPSFIRTLGRCYERHEPSDERTWSYARATSMWATDGTRKCCSSGPH
jgi:hypothetical protein